MRWMVLCALWVPGLAWAALEPQQYAEKVQEARQRVMEGNLAAGVAALDEADAEAPEDLSEPVQRGAAGLRAYTYAALQRHDDASLEWARGALEKFPDDGNLLRYVGMYAAPESDPHKRTRATSDHFRVRFQGTEPDAALQDKLLEALEQAATAMQDQLGWTMDHPADVEVYASTSAYDRATGAPAWSAACYNGRLQVPLDLVKSGGDELRETVTHELAHHAVKRLAHERVPGWFNEGLAVALAGGREVASLEEQLRTQLAVGTPKFSLAQLRPSLAALTDVRRVGLAYAQSYAAVKRAVDGRGWSAVQQVLTDVGGGTAFDSAFESRIESLDSLEKGYLDAYAR